MNFQKSIRWRIQAWYGLLLAAVIASFCALTITLRSKDAWRHGDSELSVRLGALTGELGRGGGNGPPPAPEGYPPPEGPRPEERRGPPPNFQAPRLSGIFDPKQAEPFYFVVWARDGRQIGKSAAVQGEVPKPVYASDHLTTSFRDREGVRESFVFTPPGECLLVGRSTAPVESEIHDFTWKLIGISALVLVGGWLTGWWLAARALKPIDDISATAARIAAGNLTERIALPETESELGRLAAVLDDTFQRLDAAFTEQNRFTSDAAHELRTPVSIILGQTQLALAAGRSPEEQRSALEICRRAAQRMHSLVDSLLELAVLDGRRGEGEVIDTDLAATCADTVSMLEAKASEKRIALVSNLKPAPCRADPDRISQVLENLTGNAFKFCPEGSTVTIATGTDHDGSWLRVEDDGPGIAAEHLPRLFGRFYRADASRNRATGGAGLGLAICKSIADAHQGTIHVESRPGSGTRFTLRLPAVQFA